MQAEKEHACDVCHASHPQDPYAVVTVPLQTYNADYALAPPAAAAGMTLVQPETADSVSALVSPDNQTVHLSATKDLAVPDQVSAAHATNTLALCASSREI